MSGRRNGNGSGGGNSGGTATALPAPPPKSDKEVRQADQTRRTKALLEASHERLLAVLPKHLTPEKVIQVVATLVFKTPRLQECVPETVLTSVLEACELGLELSPKMCEAYLVPYEDWKKKIYVCQLQIGYQGLQKLARQSDQIAYIHSRIVRQGDTFHLRYTPDLDFLHVPAQGRDRGEITDIYAVAKLVSGDHVIEVMTAEEIEAIHRRSQSYQAAKRGKYEENGPWATDWNEMGRKTVLKRLCKALPRSVQLAQAVEIDNQGYLEGTATVSAQPRLPGVSRSQQLAHQLGAPVAEPVFEPGTSGQIRTEAEPPDVDPESDLPVGVTDAEDRELGCDNDQ